MTDSSQSTDVHSIRRRVSDLHTEDGDAASKRRRLDLTESQAQLAVHGGHVEKRLDYHDYTVGWICALSIEMTAAMAMLDEEHESLPRKAGDDNIYILGSISGHNVVIACLRDGVYGIASATTVGHALRRTFPNSITLPLMVGIGGGVPSTERDIRLGDVVVGVPTSKGPAIKQYDLGRMTSDGLPEVSGELNKPAAILLHAVSKLKAVHELRIGNHATHISRALEQHNLDKYAYPGSDRDILSEGYCDHLLEADVCESFCSIRRVHREPRPNNNPVVHYGTIGSGNQVIKHSKMRDQIAQRFGIICFEMEAAGLMDNFPCLVVRGICDYCDAQKEKDFQKFAALSAAAYAKDLLSTIPVEEPSVQVGDSMSVLLSKQEHRGNIMEALNFEEAESRRATVKKAHLQTCKWFVGQQFFIDWHNSQDSGDSQDPIDHHGLLWIKGKPGTGKSTLMKYVLEQEEKARTKDQIIISFFFNARGNLLERTVIGMYRSLIYQILKQVPQLQSILDNFNSSTTFDQDKIGVLENLENLFRSVMERLSDQQLFCFIDALDECPEGQVRDMLSVFEELGAMVSDSNGLKLHVLLSSRHYPNITIEYGRSIVLEDQAGHSSDVLKYINSELRIGRHKHIEQIKQTILEKARGIFLWVVLTVKILRTEHDKGRLKSPMKRLNDIPLELNDIFRDIVTRDNERLPELVLCVRWILYAKRPLQRAELYSALLVGSDTEDEDSYNLEEVGPKDMDNYILDCSKGLVELTRAREPTVQFIHESVREFLLLPDSLVDLWPGFEGISEGESHQQLKEICVRYLTSNGMLELGYNGATSPDGFAEAIKCYPFSKYAAECMPHHADIAERFHLPQGGFLQVFPWHIWRNLYNCFQKGRSRRLKNKETICNFADLGLSNLILTWLSLMPSSILNSELTKVARILASARDFELYQRLFFWQRRRMQPDDEVSPDDAIAWFQLLQDAKASKSDAMIENVVIISFSWPLHTYQLPIGSRCFEFAARAKRPNVLRLFLTSPTRDTWPDDSTLLELVVKPPPSFRATESGNTTQMPHHTNLEDKETPRFANLSSDVLACVNLLFQEQTEFDSLIDLSEVAALFGTMVVEAIIKKGWNAASDITRSRSLYTAVRRKQTRLVQLLLEKGADTNKYAHQGLTPLHQAGDIASMELLLQYGSDVNGRDERGRTALHCAVVVTENNRQDFLALTSCLLRSQAYVNAKDHVGRSPLHYIARQNWSPMHRHEVRLVIESLLKHGADINAKDYHGTTVLHDAVTFSQVEIVKILVLEGADLSSTTNNKGFSPLHVAALQFAKVLNEYEKHPGILLMDKRHGYILTMLYALGMDPTLPVNIHREDPAWPRFVTVLETLRASGRPELETIVDADFMKEWKGRSTDKELLAEHEEQSGNHVLEEDVGEGTQEFPIVLE